MKKAFLSLSLILVFVLGFACQASAKDMSRHFAFGVDSTISKYHGDGRGISALYQINKFFALQMIFGIGVTSVNVDGKYEDHFKSTVTDWNISLRGIIPFLETAEVNVSAVVGFTASGTSSDGFEPADYTDPALMKYKDGYQFSIDLGIRPEWFVTDHFSLHTQVGLGINIVTHGSSTASAGLNNKTGEVVLSSKASGVSVDFFKNADLFGMAGFTFWF